MMLIEQLALKGLVILIMIGIAYFSIMMMEGIYSDVDDECDHSNKWLLLLIMFVELIAYVVIILFTIAIEIRIFKLVF